jgi:hypothetical protein
MVGGVLAGLSRRRAEVLIGCVPLPRLRARAAPVSEAVPVAVVAGRRGFALRVAHAMCKCRRGELRCIVSVVRCVRRAVRATGLMDACLGMKMESRGIRCIRVPINSGYRPIVAPFLVFNIVLSPPKEVVGKCKCLSAVGCLRFVLVSNLLVRYVVRHKAAVGLIAARPCKVLADMRIKARTSNPDPNPLQQSNETYDRILELSSGFILES